MRRALLLSLLLPALHAAGDGTTALHRAAHADDVEQVRRLLGSGADAKARNRFGVTALSLASTNGNAAMVDLLLTAGADSNEALPGGETALMTAARTGKVAVVAALIARGAKVSAREERRGQTALMWAAAEGHAAVIRLLLEHGAILRERLDSGFTAFLFAVREGRLDAVKAFVQAGASVNETIQPAAGYVRKSSQEGRGSPRAGTSALHIAATNAHYDVGAFLLDSGADANSAIPGFAPLHAIPSVRKPGGGDNDPAPQGSGAMTSIEFVKRLAKSGANLNARMTKRVSFGMTGLNTLGATPFFLAARAADAELMRTLATLGADPLLPNADNSTPLMAAAGLGTRSPGEDAGTESEVMEAAEAALDLGNDIDAVDNNGETAMHGAAYKNLPGAVELLARKGARMEVWNRPNKNGWTPLRIAEGYRFGNYKPSPPTIAAFRSLLDAGSGAAALH